MPQELFVALRRAGWLVSPVVEGRLRVGSTAVRLVGVDPLTAPPGSAASAALARTDLNRFLRADTLVAGPETAALLEANLPNPVLVDQAVAPGTVLADIGVAQKLLDRAGRISRLIVLPEQPLRQRPLAEIAPDLVLQRADGATDVGRLTDSFHLNLTAFGFLSFAVGIFIVHGAIGLAFEQRRGMVRTLRALGVPLRRLIVADGAGACRAGDACRRARHRARLSHRSAPAAGRGRDDTGPLWRRRRGHAADSPGMVAFGNGHGARRRTARRRERVVAAGADAGPCERRRARLGAGLGTDAKAAGRGRGRAARGGGRAGRRRRRAGRRLRAARLPAARRSTCAAALPGGDPAPWRRHRPTAPWRNGSGPTRASNCPASGLR